MNRSIQWARVVALSVALLASPLATADAVTDWNVQASQIVVKAIPGTPPVNRVMAIVQTAVFEAVNELADDASAEAAVAAANRATLMALVPSQKEAIEAAYAQAIAGIASGPAQDAGIAAGEQAAAAVLAHRADDGASARPVYRPFTAPGVYVPTTLPAVAQWPQRKPWLMKKPSEFRPEPPPTLGSETWARDYNEVKSLGARDGSTRTAEQTAIAHFWEGTLPSVYYGVARGVADQPGRDLRRNARLYAALTEAMDDAFIAVFDAKYHYNFWRPITAIRNGDQDGNDATARDEGWLPLIDTPMHPEYPCAHCIVAATVATVITAEAGRDRLPTLSTTSDIPGAGSRSWATPEDLVTEVSLARIYDGVHYRNSTEVGAEMGRRIGTLAARHFFR